MTKFTKHNCSSRYSGAGRIIASFAVVSASLISKGDGAYESHVALYTQEKQTPSFYDYSISLSRDGRHMDHMTARCDHGTLHERIVVDFSRFGETHIDIPNAIKESAKEKSGLKQGVLNLV